MKFCQALLCGCALLLAGCATGADELAGNSGGGIEIPNGLTVVVKDQSGVLAARAMVRLVAASDWSGRLLKGEATVLDSAVADSMGVAHFSNRAGADAWLEVRLASQGVRVALTEQKNVSLSLASLQRIDGQWPASLARPQRLWLAGTHQFAEIDSVGRFAFDSVIQGNFALVAQFAAGVHSAGHMQVGWNGLQQLSISLDTTGVVLDDFEDGDVLWRQSDLFGAGYWWISADSRLKLQDVFGVALAISLVQQDSSGKHYFHAQPKLDTVSTAWANFGLNLGAVGRAFPDIHAMSSVRVRVRGNGSWTISLNVLGPKGLELWRAKLLVDSSWKTIDVAPSQFVQVEGVPGGVLTSGTRRLTMPVFQVTKQGWLDLDAISVMGVSLANWGK